MALPTHMQALTFGGKEKIVLSTVPTPQVIRPEDVIVKVACAAICGSDLHPFHGREGGIGKNCTTGHEFVGTVVALGNNVKSHRIGDRVASPFTTNCGGCFYCTIGATCRCSHEQAGGFGWVDDEQMLLPEKDRKANALQGAHAEFVRVPLADATCVKVPDSITDEEAILLGDILSTAFFAAENGDVGPGKAVVVVGCGPVGLLSILAAQQLGASKVWAVDSIPDRLAMAASFGAETLNFKACDVLATVRAGTEGRGADVALELVGTSQALRLGFDCIRPGGTLSSIGVNTDAAFPFSPQEAYGKQLTFKCGRCPARQFMEKLMPQLAASPPEARPPYTRVFTHRMHLHEGVEGYRLFNNREAIKVLLSCA
ncbi:chaperonin 10-like protein [Dunaliella salina]|uniref:Chaperonin 10-like protein n=1 Tax=Dunaliella salina TaxID=3046 RepID=A0ABQ7GHZ6_DUNSA|nr:chaperonin 10-like protein [Dunaliella salina]|eukprot:KAF5834241.1 chaperonin 10-like protein [Dunaliella salina]